MSYVPASRRQKAASAKPVVPSLSMIIGYGAFAVAFCFTAAVVFGLVP